MLHRDGRASEMLRESCRELEQERARLLSENAVLEEEVKELQAYIDSHLGRFVLSHPILHCSVSKITKYEGANGYDNVCGIQEQVVQLNEVMEGGMEGEYEMERTDRERSLLLSLLFISSSLPPPHPCLPFFSFPSFL